MTRKTTNAKNATQSRVFPIVLKTIINDAINDKTIVDDNAKKIRAKLRADENVKTFHVMNTSHVAHDQSQYDAIRCAFDRAYAQRLIDDANAQRDAKRAQRATKRKTTSRVDNETHVDDNAQNEVIA